MGTKNEVTNTSRNSSTKTLSFLLSLLIYVNFHIPVTSGFSPQAWEYKKPCKFRIQHLFQISRKPLSSRNVVRPDEIDRDQISFNIELTNTTDLEMVSMSAIGLAFSIGVIYALASTTTPEGNIEMEGRAFETVYANVMDAALPRDVTDVLTVVLGEAIGGFIGAVSTSIVTSLLKLKMEVQQKSLLVEAVADGDYFLARAAVLPLLTAFGVPEIIASIASVLVATIPYELVKLGPKRREQLKAADDLRMEALLQSQKNKKMGNSYRLKSSQISNEETMAKPESLLDIPDIFADIIRWLEYDVLKSDFGNTLVDPSGYLLSPGVEGAIFGFLAGLSSQLYLDTVRTYTDYGPEEKRIEARTRSFSGWISLYSTTCLSTAALFGVYETCKKPISLYVAGVLSGGFDGCLGSSNVKACLDAYVNNNPPEPTLGAQVRAFITVLVSFWDRLTLEGAYETQQAAITALLQFYNVITSHPT
jgi:hypothetical protein